ncbi:MAG TPA: hypothetical protein VGI19_15850 [Candidatus Cybelea sp.]|jgi:hypothetical protein
MTKSILSRLSSVACAVTLVAGCSGAQGGAPSAVPISDATALRGDLVYVAAYNSVAIYTYPRGKRVGALTGFSNAVAVCTGTSGNVWVVDSKSHRFSELLKYAHGGSKPIATLQLKGHGADACAVDPSTGNLAAGTLDSNVVVWIKGKGSPTLYSTRGFIKHVQTISYDGTGDLYMRSFKQGNSAAWLPKGGSGVTRFSVTQVGAYGWDGQHLVITGNEKNGIEHLPLYKLQGGNGKIAGHVLLGGCQSFYNITRHFSVAGTELAFTCGLDETASLNYYKYPSGGNPIKSIYGVAGSVAISVGSSRLGS